MICSVRRITLASVFLSAVVIGGCGSQNITPPGGPFPPTPLGGGTAGPSPISTGTSVPVPGASPTMPAIATPAGAVLASTGLITSANGGSVDLGDGSRLDVPPGAFSSDAYVQLAEIPGASVTGFNALFKALPGTLHLTLVPAPAIGNASSRRLHAAAGPAARATLAFHVPSATFAALTPASLPFMQLTTADGTLPYATKLVASPSAGTVTALLPSTLSTIQPNTTAADYGVIDGLITKARGVCGDSGVGLRFYDRYSHTWAAGAPPRKAFHPLLVLHGLGSCTEAAFKGGVDASNQDSTIDRLLEDGSYDAAIGYNYAWSHTPDEVIPGMTLAVNAALGNVQHLDIFAHSYGCIMAMALIPNLQAQNIDNLTLVGGPLDGSFLNANDFAITYLTSPAGVLLGDTDPAVAVIADIAALEFEIQGADWRSTFAPGDGNTRLRSIEKNLMNAPNAPFRVTKLPGQ